MSKGLKEFTLTKNYFSKIFVSLAPRLVTVVEYLSKNILE